MPRILLVVGTRPDIIKMAPVAKGLEVLGMDYGVVNTFQSPDLVQPFWSLFFDWMEERRIVRLPLVGLPEPPDTMLGKRLSSLIRRFSDFYANESASPALVVVQGDTLTQLAAAQAAFLSGLSVAHVEAGLRSSDIREPYPEEVFRRITDQLTGLFLIPSPSAARNIRKEFGEKAFRSRRAVLTGNTSIDSLLMTVSRFSLPIDSYNPGSKTIVITLHRRENILYRPRSASIIRAFLDLASKFPDIRFLFFTHPHTRMALVDNYRFNSVPPNLEFLPPADHRTFIGELCRSRLVITDSGGIQEELTVVHVPALILRAVTERPEIVQAGMAWIVGDGIIDPGRIFSLADQLIRSEKRRVQMSSIRRYPYGDGQAGAKIALAIRDYLSGK